MLDDAELYSRSNSLQYRDSQMLMDCVLDKMSRVDDDIVMDIGCGTGDSTRNILLPRIPKLKRLIGVDILPGMIEFAKSNRLHEKIEYHVGDVEDWTTLENWQGKTTKVFSFFCFHWLKDQKKGFENVFKLLSPQGEAAFVFCVYAAVWNCHSPLVSKPKWAKYLKDADFAVPASHYHKYDGDHFRKMLTEIGYDVILCEEVPKSYTYGDDADFKKQYASYCPACKFIPDEEREEFMDDILKEFTLHGGRESSGKPMVKYIVLNAHVKKIQRKESA